MTPALQCIKNAIVTAYQSWCWWFITCKSNIKILNFPGHRFRTTYDFGFAALDILSVYPEDSGEYTCKATNKLGTATSSIKLNVKCK